MGLLTWAEREAIHAECEGDGNEEYCRIKWLEVERSGRRHHYTHDHNGRPVMLPPAQCKWVDHARKVRQQFAGILLAETGGFHYRGGGDSFITKSVLVAPGTSLEVEKAIIAAYKSFVMPKGVHWSRRHEGPIWVYRSESEYRSGAE